MKSIMIGVREGSGGSVDVSRRIRAVSNVPSGRGFLTTQNTTPSLDRGDPEVLRTLGAGRSGRRRWLVWLVVLALLGLAVGAYTLIQRRRSQQPVERYTTAKAQVIDLRETVVATGTLSPLDSVEVGAEVTGRVLRVSADINDQVKAGQILVEIDPQQLEARIEESQAQLLSAQASLKNSKTTVTEAELKAARTRELHGRGLVSNQELEAADAARDRAQSAVVSAAAQVTVAQAGLKLARTALSKAEIRSPIDGIVLARTVEPGQTVTAGFQTPILFTLARDLTQMQLKVDIDEADIGKVKQGLHATFVVDAYQKRRFDSKVLRLNNLPKPETTVVTYEALLSVDNQERLLKPGMTATATIVTSEHRGVLSVPNAALRFEPAAAKGPEAAARPNLAIPGLGAGPFGGPNRPRAAAGPGDGARRGGDAVYVLEAGRPRRIPVEVGASDGQRTEVRSPALKPGSEVVIDSEGVSG
jgi:HlyD family secretion protein